MRVAILLLLVVVVCCSAAKLRKPASKANVKAVKKFAMAMVNSKRNYQRSVNEARGETTVTQKNTQGKTQKKTHTKAGKTEKKQYDGYNPNCVGAKCECDDSSLYGELLGKVGDVVATCRITALYEKLYYDRFVEELVNLTTKRGYLDNVPYDFYGEACAFMEELGLMMQHFSYYSEGDYNADDSEDYPSDLWDAYESIDTCCDIKEYIATFNCLGTYMSLLEMKIAEAFHIGSTTDNSDYLRNDNFDFLEFLTRYQCDLTFGNEVCLVMGLTGVADLDSCQVRISPLDPSYTIDIISPEELAAEVAEYYNDDETESDPGSGEEEEEDETANENTQEEEEDEDEAANQNTGEEEEDEAANQNAQEEEGTDEDGQEDAFKKRANESPKWKELSGLLERVLKQRELNRKR